MHFTNSWVVSGRLQLWNWLFLSLQKACNCAKCNCLLTCLTAYLSLAWYRTTWKLSDNGWARAFVSALGKHLSAVTYSPKFSKQDDTDGKRIKGRKLVTVRKQVGQKLLLAVPISVSSGSCLVFGLFRSISLVDWGMFCGLSDFNLIFAAVLSFVGAPFPRMGGWEMTKHYWAVWKS